MQDIHDIKPIIEIALLSHWEKIFFLLFLVLLAVIIISVVAYFVLKKYFRRTSSSTENLPNKIIDYQAILEKRLQSCRKIQQSGRYKEFHLCLSRAVKEYIGYKRKFRALDMTTKEILKKLQSFPVEQKLLEQFFFINDMAKYANYGLEEETARRAYDLVRKISHK